MGDDPNEQNFREFLRALVAADFVEGTALGVMKFVIANSREKLSQKQEAVFQKQVIDEFVHEKCKVCNQTIPWSEMFQAIDSGVCAACVRR
jgi:hypothetical protein